MTKLGNDNIPMIGIGPGSILHGESFNVCSGDNIVGKLINKVSNKVFYLKRSHSYRKNITNALNIGFRLIDYSAAYGDGVLIGKAIKQSKVPREELIITTRVSNYAQRTHTIREEFFLGLQGLGLEYVDLLQFHWPVTDVYLETWREMERLKDEGYVRHLGVANCHQHHLEEIFRICKHRPEIGQFEIHPLFTQKPLIQYYKEQGIVVEAYTPVARYDDRLVRLPLLKQMEKKYKKTFVQIILRWHIQNGVIPLVRTLNPKHQQENIDIFDFELSDADMQLIDGININSRLRYDPDNCDFSIL